MKDENWIRERLKEVNDKLNKEDQDWKTSRFNGMNIMEMMDMAKGYRELVGRRDVLKEILEED
jgi:hypothetical protein